MAGGAVSAIVFAGMAVIAQPPGPAGAANPAPVLALYPCKGSLPNTCFGVNGLPGFGSTIITVNRNDQASGIPTGFKLKEVSEVSTKTQNVYNVPMSWVTSIDGAGIYLVELVEPETGQTLCLDPAGTFGHYKVVLGQCGSWVFAWDINHERDSPMWLLYFSHHKPKHEAKNPPKPPVLALALIAGGQVAIVTYSQGAATQFLKPVFITTP